MNGKRLLLATVLISTLCCCEGATSLPSFEGALRSAVVDGAETPGDLGVEVSPLEENAVVGAVGSGCTGTIVGDRVVVTAGHCVMGNLGAWLDGAEPSVVSPRLQSYVVGPDMDAPLCDPLEAEEIHLHPDIEIDFDAQVILHDVAVVVLRDSIIERCPDVVPLQINREPLTEELVDAEVLQGGFGSLDDTYNFSPIRYWSLTEVVALRPDELITFNLGQGFPTYGDSGAGALLRYPDGSLRNLGVCSAGNMPSMGYVRLDAQGELFDEVLDRSLICGPVDEAGACRDDVLLTCDSSGYWSRDCAAEGLVCAEDEEGVAACVCACDEEVFCEEGCECDSDCPCDCDGTDGCDDGCDCDPACHASTPDAGPDGGDGGGEDASPGDEGGGSGCSAAAAARRAPTPILVAALLLALLRRSPRGAIR